MTKQETFDGEYASTDEELDQVRDLVLAAKDLPVAERISNMTRLLARFLHKRGKLPDHLKKNLDN